MVKECQGRKSGDIGVKGKNRKRRGNKEKGDWKKVGLGEKAGKRQGRGEEERRKAKQDREERVPPRR